MHGTGKAILLWLVEVNVFIIQPERMVGAETELGYSSYVKILETDDSGPWICHWKGERELE